MRDPESLWVLWVLREAQICGGLEARLCFICAAPQTDRQLARWEAEDLFSVVDKQLRGLTRKQAALSAGAAHRGPVPYSWQAGRSCLCPPTCSEEGEAAGESRPQVSASRGLGSGSTPCQDVRVYTQGSQNPPQGRTSLQGEDFTRAEVFGNSVRIFFADPESALRELAKMQKETGKKEKKK